MGANTRSEPAIRSTSALLAAILATGFGSILAGNASATVAAVSVAVQTPTLLASQSVSVVLTTNSTVPAGQVLKLKSLTTTGTHGTVTQTNSATVTYAPGSYYASLPQNTTATDSFAYCLADAAGAYACSTVNITISGVAAAAAPVTATSTAYTCVRNWYVSQNGSDKAAGTTVSTPWLTLQHANDSGLLTAGDCVNVASGSYLITKSLNLTHGGTANSPTGYVVYRSTTPQGAKIQAATTGMVDVVDVQSDYMIIDGFEVDGGNLGLVRAPFTTGTGIMANGHHFQAVNNLVHDCGGEGIGALYKDWYWIVGNTTYNNAHFNGYHMSGISIYEPRPVSFTATSADTNAVYHIVVKGNISHDNAELYVASAHTDGNGIILDDFRNSQSGMAAYPYKSLVQGNTVYNNGGRGVHLFFTDNVAVDSNKAYGNNTDATQTSTWRGDLSNSFASNTSWTNNQASATSVATDVRRYNTAVLDGHSGAANVNVVWLNNTNIDTRTGGKSYQIDDATRATTFPPNNPLGKAL